MSSEKSEIGVRSKQHLDRLLKERIRLAFRNVCGEAASFDPI